MADRRSGGELTSEIPRRNWSRAAPQAPPRPVVLGLRQEVDHVVGDVPRGARRRGDPAPGALVGAGAADNRDVSCHGFRSGSENAEPVSWRARLRSQARLSGGAALAVAFALAAASATAAPPSATTFARAGERAVATLLGVFYAGN